MEVLIGKEPINVSFSTAMFDYQRVYRDDIWIIFVGWYRGNIIPEISSLHYISDDICGII